MNYLSTMAYGHEDAMTSMVFDGYQEAFENIKYANNHHKNSKKEQPKQGPKIEEIGCIKKEEILCKYCLRTTSNGIRCLGMCVADSEY